MRIGVFVGASVADLMTLDGLLARIKQAEDDGFDSFWIPHISARGYDALTVLSMAGMQTSRIELGVGVVPTYPRHPAALAQQALTTATATNGRFILGIGPSHRPGMEEGFGIPYDRPALHTREYLSVMRPLLEEGAVQIQRRVLQLQPGTGRPWSAPLAPSWSRRWRPQMLQHRRAARPTERSPGWPAPAPSRPTSRRASSVLRRIADAEAPRVTASACPRRPPTMRTRDAGRPRSPTPATVSWSTTAVSSTSRAWRARRRWRSSGTSRRYSDRLEAFAEGGATDFVGNIFDVPGEPESSQRAYEALKSLVGRI